MAVTFSVPYTRVDEILLDPGDIVIKPELNGRHDAPNIEALQASIEKVGQLQPVTVRREGDKPVLVMGFSRWTAITEINKKRDPKDRIHIRAVYMKVNEEDGYIYNYEENRRRNATTPMDDAHQFAQLMKWGRTEEQIAIRLNIMKKGKNGKPDVPDVAFVKHRLLLIEATPELQAAVSSGDMKVTAATRLAKLSSEQQRKLVSERKKITTADVAAASGAKRKPSMARVKERIEEEAYSTATEKSDPVKKFCLKLLKFMDGEES